MFSVLCFGNELHGDDGFGHAVYTQLNHNLTAALAKKIHYCGTNSQTVWPLIKNCKQLLIVDAMLEPTSSPGQVSWITATTFCAEKTDLSHLGGVAELIRHLPLLFDQGKPPQTHLLTCTVREVAPCTLGLSNAIADAVPVACEMLTAKISRYEEAY